MQKREHLPLKNVPFTKLIKMKSVQKPACASQIVSHILRMWRLIISKTISKDSGGYKI